MNSKPCISDLPKSSLKFAIFDFDHTLTDRDSLLPFLFYVKGFWKTIFYLILLTPIFLKFLLGIVSRQKTKEKILARFIGGMPWKEVQSLGRNYADNALDQYLKPEAMERLKWHQLRGDRCLLNSASLEFYLKPWAARHGLEFVLASQLEISPSNHVTGRLKGLNCWGEEKKRRLLEYLESLKEGKFELYVYGDSRGDKEILDLANYPFYRVFK